MHAAGKTTVLRDIPLDATVDDVYAAWAALLGQPESLGSVRASTLKGRALQGCQVVSKALGPHPELCLALTSHQLHADDGHGIKFVPEEAGIPRGSPAETAIPGVDHASETNESRASTSPLIAPLLERAAEKEASQHYKSAAFIYEQVRSHLQCGLVPSMSCPSLRFIAPHTHLPFSPRIPLTGIDLCTLCYW